MTPLQNYLQVQLALMQHHIDDAEVYGATGHQDAAHLSLDDAEEGVERVSESVLPEQGQQVVEKVEEEGDEEEEDAGVELEEPKVPGKQEEKVACFQLGMDVLCRQVGIVGARRELFRKVASHIALGRISSPQEVLRCVAGFGEIQKP